MESEHQVPIWFFVGALLLVYGVLIVGAGIYAFVCPPPVEHRVALFELHADLWWGLLLVALGAFYCLRFHPWHKPQ
jgi:hypothetical protein